MKVQQLYKNYLDYLYRSGEYNIEDFPSFEQYVEDYAESDDEAKEWEELNRKYNIEEDAKEEQWDLNRDAQDTVNERWDEYNKEVSKTL